MTRQLMRLTLIVWIAATVTACDDGRTGPRPAVSELDTAAATTSPDAEAATSVVYQGPDGLHVVHADGSGDAAWRPAGVTGRANHPDWSPDGQRLAFVADEADATTDIWVAHADGSGATKLVDCVAPCSFVEDPAWSPDGAQIVYWSNGDTYTDELRVTDVATGQTVRVVQPPESTGVSHPRWSPDGTRVSADTGVYSSDGVLTSMAVGVYDLTEDEPVPTVVTPADSSTNFADWSPDGSMIAYQGGNPDPFAGGARSDIFVSAPDGSGARRLTDAEESGVGYALPSWSADGRLLLVTVIRPAGDYRIAWIDVASGDVRELTSSAGAPIVGAHAVQCCA